jgi:hypothetical protein
MDFISFFTFGPDFSMLKKPYPLFALAPKPWRLLHTRTVVYYSNNKNEAVDNNTNIAPVAHCTRELISFNINSVVLIS